MLYVYILESGNEPSQACVGQTGDLRIRLSNHGTGKTPHTAKHRPWRLVCYHAFADENRAIAFERYLKTGSGRDFRRRHFGV